MQAKSTPCVVCAAAVPGIFQPIFGGQYLWADASPGIGTADLSTSSRCALVAAREYGANTTGMAQRAISEVDARGHPMTVYGARGGRDLLDVAPDIRIRTVPALDAADLDGEIKSSLIERSDAEKLKLTQATQEAMTRC